MQEHSQFVSSVLNICAPLGPVTAKRMFGGYGLFLDGKMFALVSRDEELFLKADDMNKAAFIERGSASYGKMPYYSAPEETLDGWDEMAPWAEGAVEASRRAKKK